MFIGTDCKLTFISNDLRVRKTDLFWFDQTERERRGFRPESDLPATSNLNYQINLKLVV
jgi:hypothetical protein